MSSKSLRHTRYVGHERIYIFDREGGAKPYGLQRGSSKVVWFASSSARERIITRIAKQNAKDKRAYKARIKEAMFTCVCGCGETFQAAYKTRRPQFKDDTHKAAYDNARREAKRAARMKAKLAEQKKRRLSERKASKTQVTEAASADGRTGKGSRRGTRGQGSPLLASADKGLYADLPAPERSKKRKSAGLPVADGD